MLSFYDISSKGNPLTPDFHRTVIREVENRVNAYSPSFDELEATLEQLKSCSKYGYGAKFLFPYGFYHPTRILDKVAPEYKRGRLLTKCIASKEPVYRYYFEKEGDLLAIEATVPSRKGWDKAKVLTFVYQCTQVESIYLTFTARDATECSPTLSNVAWEINREDRTFIHIVSGGWREGHFVGYSLDTEIHYPEDIFCERFEYTFEPSIGRKTGKLLRYVYDLQHNV